MLLGGDTGAKSRFGRFGWPGFAETVGHCRTTPNFCSLNFLVSTAVVGPTMVVYVENGRPQNFFGPGRPHFLHKTDSRPGFSEARKRERSSRVAPHPRGIAPAPVRIPFRVLRGGLGDRSDPNAAQSRPTLAVAKPCPASAETL